MDPEALHDGGRLAVVRNGEQHALDDTGEVSQVEQVVRLGWRGQKVLHGGLVDICGGRHNLVDDWLKVLGKAPELIQINSIQFSFKRKITCVYSLKVV